jgi:hypothetical protein
MHPRNIPVNGPCPCNSGKKFKKCCMNIYLSYSLNRILENRKEEIYEIEDINKDNMEKALKLFGNDFVGILIKNNIIGSLICHDDHSIILGRTLQDIDCIYHNVLIKNGILYIKPMYYHKNKIINNLANTIEKYSILYKWIENCLMISILFNEGLAKLNINSSIEEGFICYNDKYAQRYYWVEINGHKIDIANGITIQLYPECSFLNFKLLKEIPKDYHRINANNDNEIIKSINMEKTYNLYKLNTKEFWRCARKDETLVKTFPIIDNIENRINEFVRLNK